MCSESTERSNFLLTLCRILDFLSSSAGFVATKVINSNNTHIHTLLHILKILLKNLIFYDIKNVYLQY